MKTTCDQSIGTSYPVTGLIMSKNKNFMVKGLKIDKNRTMVGRNNEYVLYSLN